MTAKYIRTGLAACALAFLLTLAGAAHALAEDEVQVEFSSMPPAVQQALVRYAGASAPGTTATAWIALGDNDEIIYRGKITDLDGSTRIINVDENGDLLDFRDKGPRWWRIFRFGREVPWGEVPRNVRNTIAANAGGREIGEVTRRKAANGVIYYRAETTDAEGLPLVIEATQDGELLDVTGRGK